MHHRILLIDDDDTGRELGVYNLQGAGYEVQGAVDGERGLASFSDQPCDLVISDLRMPGVSGMDVLREIKRRAPEVPVIVITAHGNVETAVEAMKAGAYDFLEKPFRRDELLMLVQRALERLQLARENRELRLRARGVEREIVARSAQMAQLLRQADRVAGREVAVLITGESGTGKELIARRIHARSARAEQPFVVVNCAAVPRDLLESELFGHEQGAFTGASRARLGRFRKADRGSIFLDEVGELPPSLQSKLLRVLQEHTVDVVGRDQPVAVDARVIAATNSDLRERAAEGTFREDLYYRLDVFQLNIPPLRERPEDVDVLVEHFVRRASPGEDLLIPEALVAELRRRPWPGNVRELENTCERLVILCERGELTLADLDPSAGTPVTERASVIGAEGWPPLPADGLSLIDLERQVIERALALKQGNITQTATYLRIPRHVLVYRIAKYGLRRG